LGCGVGGPLRNITAFSRAKITGLNISEYQLGRAANNIKNAGLHALANVMYGDFMKIPFDEGTFDRAYHIEATCHAPSREGVYKEIFRVLKPGGLVGGFEWLMTYDYDANNSNHVAIKESIERSNALPELETIANVLAAMKSAGFEIIENFDLAAIDAAGCSAYPWYYPLTGRLSATGLWHTTFGRYLTGNAVKLLEKFHLIPSGTHTTLDMLNSGADALVLGGKLGVFTPMWWILARKPE